MGIDLLHRKESLILTAIDIIDELGIQRLTTREIANRQNISEATMFRHYKNKNELLLAVLDYYVQFDTDIIASTRLSGLEPLDAIRYYVREYAQYYENYPAITSLTQIYDVLRYDKDLAGKVKEIQDSRNITLKDLIQAAQKAGEIRQDYDSMILTVMINGFFREICLNWRLDHDSFPLEDRIMKALEILLDTCK